MDAQDIYRRHVSDVYRFALYLSGNTATAEDLAAEAFVRLWTTSSPIRTETVKAYLFAIVRNLHSDAARRSRTVTELDERLADPVDRVEGPAAQRSEVRHALRLLAHLSADDRAALLMRAADVAYADIARTLGITTAAAKVRIHRARMKIALLNTSQETLP